MIKAEIYWIFGNRLRKISPKLLPQKAKVYLENFLKIDFNEFSNIRHNTYMNEIKNGSFFKCNNIPEFNAGCYQFLVEKINIQKNISGSITSRFSEELTSARRLYRLTENEQKSLVEKAKKLNIDVNCMDYNDWFDEKIIVVHKEELKEFLNFIENESNSKIKIFEIRKFLGDKYKVFLYWGEKFSKILPTDKNIFLRYYETSDININTFLKKIKKITNDKS